MPMTFTDSLVERRLFMFRLGQTGTPKEKRERLAKFVEDKYQDYVEAWEIRSGRPWTEMTADEAAQEINKHPALMRNPGVLSRLLAIP